MQKNLSVLRAFVRFSDMLLPFLLFSVLLPLLVLAGFGLYAILRYAYFLHFAGILLLVTLVSGLGVWLWRVREKKKKKASFVPFLPQQGGELPAYWLEQDQGVHVRLFPLLPDLLEDRPEWKDLYKKGMEVLRLVAEQYGRGGRHGEWSFTAPELLAVAERVCVRYRRVLKENVPGIDHIRISSLFMLHDQKAHLQRGKRLYNVYRALRLLTPEGWIAELRGHIFSQVFKDMGEEMQHRLKHLFLIEVLHTGIDLYGGHFRFDGEEIPESAVSRKDVLHLAMPLEPVRISMLGQVSAGKSTIVNILTETLSAEVDVLPATERGQVYRCSVGGSHAVSLVDLPGLDGDARNESQLMEEVLQSDLLLWVLKANQPARRLDVDFMRKLQAWSGEKRNERRRLPVILGLLHQVDRLAPPGRWQPPVDLGEDTETAASIRDALDYTREVLGVTEILPLALPEKGKAFNVSALQSFIQAHILAALNVQLNRRRQETGDLSLKREVQRIQAGLSNLFRHFL